MVYNYFGRPMQIDLTKISGDKKNVWWYSPKDGALQYVGEFENAITTFRYDGVELSGNDQVLIAIDASKAYIDIANNKLSR